MVCPMFKGPHFQNFHFLVLLGAWPQKMLTPTLNTKGTYISSSFLKEENIFLYVSFDQLTNNIVHFGGLYLFCKILSLIWNFLFGDCFLQIREGIHKCSNRHFLSSLSLFKNENFAACVPRVHGQTIQFLGI